MSIIQTIEVPKKRKVAELHTDFPMTELDSGVKKSHSLLYNGFLKMAAQPVKMVAKPIKVETMPIKMKAQPIKMEAQPIKLEVQPIKLEAQPIKLKAANQIGGLANQSEG